VVDSRRISHCWRGFPAWFSKIRNSVLVDRIESALRDYLRLLQLILMCIAVAVSPLFIIMLLLCVPFPVNTILTLGLLVGHGIAAGLKDWFLYKSKEND